MKTLLALAILIVCTSKAFALERETCSASQNGVVLDTQSFDERTILSTSIDTLVIIDSDDVTPNLEVWTSTKTDFMKDPTGAAVPKGNMQMGEPDSTFSTVVGGITVTCRN